MANDPVTGEGREAFDAVTDLHRPGPWPLHYGLEPGQVLAQEYRAAREGAALLDLTHRGLLGVSGPARVRFLQAMLTNDVAALKEAGTCSSALLDPRGSVLALLRVVVSTDAIILETDRACLSRVQTNLERHRVAAPVRFRSLPDVVFGLTGPEALPLLTGLTHLAGQDPAEDAADVTLAGTPVRLVPARDLGRGAFALHVSPGSAPSIWRALVEAGARPVGRLAFDAIRVEDGLPWWGSEVNEKTLLHEAGLAKQLCSFSKGCYVGQEIVARLEARGANVNRALCALRSASLLEAGACVSVEGDSVGIVTTAAHSPRLGPVALAYVHRRHFAPGTSVTVGEQSATVHLLPIEEDEWGRDE
jgi:folate-binding protein YgfZ